MSDISVIFNADTGQFVAAVDAAGKAVSKSAEDVAKAKNSILASYKAQVQAAQQNGASANELANIQQKAASKMSAVTEQNAQRMIAALDRVATRNRAISAEMGNLNAVAPLTRGLGELSEASERTASSIGHMGTGARAVSGAFMELEGKMPIRAVEQFLARSEMLAPLLQAAFPVIGAIALGGALIELGSKAYHAYQDIVNLKSAIAGLNQMQISVDARVRGLGDQIEAQVEDAIGKTQGKVAELQRKNQYQQNKPTDLSEYFYNDKFSKLPDNVKANYETLYKNIAPADLPARLSQIRSEVTQLNTALASTSNAFATVKSVNGYGPSATETPSAYYQARLTAAKQVASQVQAEAQLRSAEGTARNADMAEAQKQADEKNQRQASEAQRKAEEAQRRLQEQARKAAEVQRATWVSELDKQKLSGKDTPQDTADFWTGKVNSPSTLALNKPNAQHEQAVATLSAQKADAEEWKKLWEAGYKDERDAWAQDHAAWESAGNRTAADEASYWQKRMASALPGENYLQAEERYNTAMKAVLREAEDAQKARDKASLASDQQAATYASTAVGIQLATGAISKQDAALQLANIHAMQYAQTLSDLQKRLAEQQKIDPDSAGTVDAQAAIAKATAERQVQIMQDAAATAATTWSGALKNADMLWVQDAEDTAKQVSSLFKQTVDGLNSDIANLMVGKKANFADTFRNVGKSLGEDALKHVEAPALKALGLSAKADGSSSNPFWVRIANAFGGNHGSSTGIAAGASSAVAGVQGLFSEGGSSTDQAVPASGLGKALGGIIGGLGSMVGGIFGGGRALGGPVTAGVTYDVNEHGMEQFTPSTNGYITPADKVGGGGGATYNVQVANGVTPEQMRMYMHQALSQLHPVVKQTSVSAVRDHQARRPSSSR